MFLFLFWREKVFWLQPIVKSSPLIIGLRMYAEKLVLKNNRNLFLLFTKKTQRTFGKEDFFTKISPIMFSEPVSCLNLFVNKILNGPHWHNKGFAIVVLKSFARRYNHSST